jgi:hypothetical protein
MVGLGMLSAHLDLDMSVFSSAMSAGQCWMVGMARLMLRVRRKWVQVAVIDTPSWSLDENVSAARTDAGTDAGTDARVLRTRGSTAG